MIPPQPTTVRRPTFRLRRSHDANQIRHNHRHTYASWCNPLCSSSTDGYRNSDRRHVRRPPHDEGRNSCTKQGSDFALVSEGKVYTLKGDRVQRDKFAGQNMTIKGKVDGKDNHGRLDSGRQVLESVFTIAESAAASALAPLCASPLDDQDG